MHQHGSLPRARQAGLLEEATGEELLLYDQDSHAAHCLSPIAACIWRHCDGEHSVTELAQFARASESLVAGVLRELREKDLLAAETEVVQSTIPGESRRESIGRVARYGAAAVSGSLIVSVTAATQLMAGPDEKRDGGCRKTGSTPADATCCQCRDGTSRSNLEEGLCVLFCVLGGHLGAEDWKKGWEAVA